MLLEIVGAAEPVPGGRARRALDEHLQHPPEPLGERSRECDS